MVSATAFDDLYIKYCETLRKNAEDKKKLRDQVMELKKTVRDLNKVISTMEKGLSEYSEVKYEVNLLLEYTGRRNLRQLIEEAY